MLCIVEMDIGLGDMDEPQQQLFDCCICSQCTPSTSERLVGLVTLLQPSSGMLYLACILFVTVVIFTCAFLLFYNIFHTIVKVNTLQLLNFLQNIFV